MTEGANVDPQRAAVDLGALNRAVEALRGMAYEHRLHILVLLRDGAATPGTLTAAISVHATVISHHLRHLARAGLVRRRRQGQEVFYSLSGDGVGRLVDEILRYTADPTFP